MACELASDPPGRTRRIPTRPGCAAPAGMRHFPGRHGFDDDLPFYDHAPRGDRGRRPGETRMVALHLFRAPTSIRRRGQIGCPPLDVQSSSQMAGNLPVLGRTLMWMSILLVSGRIAEFSCHRGVDDRNPYRADSTPAADFAAAESLPSGRFPLQAPRSDNWYRATHPPVLGTASAAAIRAASVPSLPGNPGSTRTHSPDRVPTFSR